MYTHIHTYIILHYVLYYIILYHTTAYHITSLPGLNVVGEVPLDPAGVPQVGHLCCDICIHK